MPKRSSKDVNQLAASIVEQITRELVPVSRQIARAAEEAVTGKKKNPAAVSLGRKGGLKGGKARAASLSPAKRAQIARKAAKARWKAKK